MTRKTNSSPASGSSAKAKAYAIDDLTYEEAAELFHYDPETGIIRRATDRHKGRWAAGTIAGTHCKTNGYVIVGVNLYGTKRGYKAHRLGWLLHYGVWPTLSLDHINGVRHDNRIKNLREATQTQNMANQGPIRHGLKGAYPTPEGKWRAIIGRSPNYEHIGVYFTEQEAHDAWCAAAARRYGEFARFD